MAKKRVLVIGAGASGLSAVRACREENLSVVCCEKSGDFGGLWRYRDTDVDGAPSVMKSTVTNTSKEMSSFSNFPMPRHFPMYLPHEYVIKYLEMYSEHFDLFSSINYYEEVVEMVPAQEYGSNGQWLVKIRNLQRDETREEVFDGVAVCTGHHAYPITPNYPGLNLFAGRVMHSHSYKTSAGFEDKTVLIVGTGNSGTDVAVELSAVSKKVYLSTRRGVWIFPRNVKKGKPLDAAISRRYFLMQPAEIIEKRIQKLANNTMDHEKFGIRPYHRATSQQPTINEEIISKLSCGAVTVKKDVKEFTENGVRFDREDEVTPIDAVIFATGYDIKFPFLSEDILRVGKNSKVSLFKNVFPPQLKHPSLAIIGLLQPNGPLFPIFEMQSRWFAALMSGECSLPSTDIMLAEVRKAEDFRARNYVQSQRHSIETAWLPYMDDIADQIGAKPNLARLLLEDPKLFKACFMGPCLPFQYRLSGPHNWDDARETILTYKSRLYGAYGFSEETQDTEKP